jgi:hypothetical protein
MSDATMVSDDERAERWRRAFFILSDDYGWTLAQISKMTPEQADRFLLGAAPRGGG